jgi:anaerobic ribonucleoside-triphosphate reductase
MAEGICYVCNQSYTAPSQDAVVDQIVEHMMAQHLGYIRRDTLESKNKFDKCPNCGAALGKPLVKCPNCGADLIEQYARKVTKRYVKGR